MNNKKLVVFDTVCNSNIGFGHLKRCIGYYKILLRKKNKCFIFVNKNSSTDKILKEAKINNYLFKNKNNKIANASNIFKKFQNLNKIIIFDNYEIKQKDIMESKLFFNKVGYIDDIGRILNTDFVINYSIENNKFNYICKKKLLGKKYLPIYRKSKTKNISKIKRILITFGALDHYNLSKKIFKWFEKNQYNFEFIIIIGMFYKNKKKLYNYFSHYKNVKIYLSPNEIQSYMKNSDLIICAGGFTVYEGISNNKIVLSIQLWKNQKNTGKNLNQNNLKIIKYSFNENSFFKKFEQVLLKLQRQLKKKNIVNKYNFMKINKFSEEISKI